MTKQSGYATKQTGYFWTKQLGLNTNNIEIPVSGGGGLQSIGPGMYLFTMPDGRQITFNDAGEITNIQ